MIRASPREPRANRSYTATASGSETLVLTDRRDRREIGACASAFIDIGSNTTRLLVAESDGTRLHWVHQERAFTRIGYELFARGSIGPAKIAEVVEVVRGQRL